VVARDLANQGQAEAEASVAGRTRTGCAVEGGEDTLALTFGHARAVVLDGNEDLQSTPLNFRSDSTALAVKACVGEEVAHHALEHGRFAGEHDGLD